jgi:DNA polymerase III subunit delta'
MAFHDIVGNSRVIRTLQLALRRGRVPNSILFGGPKGVGKRDAARTLAKALNCLNKVDDSCDQCANCRAIDEERFPDVLDIDPERSLGRVKDDDADDDKESNLPSLEEKPAPARLVKITEARLMKQLAHLKPMAGRKRVFIVDQAETMMAETWNTLLKILEEPPLFTHFILISDKPDLLLSTVRSRCQTFAFLPLSAAEIERVLCGKDVEEEQARIIARIVRGDLDQALDMDWDEVREERREAWNQLRDLIAGAGEGPALFLKRISFQRGRKAREALDRRLELWSSFCRDLILLGEGGEPRLLFNPDYEAELRASAAGSGLDRAITCARLVDEARADLERNANASLQASAMVSQMLG